MNERTLLGIDCNGAVSGSPIKHQLKYSIWSCKVSWCPICLKHFYNERNEINTTKATSEHYHLLDCH